MVCGTTWPIVESWFVGDLRLSWGELCFFFVVQVVGITIALAILLNALARSDPSTLRKKEVKKLAKYASLGAHILNVHVAFS